MFYNKDENYFYAEFAEGSADKVIQGQDASYKFFKYRGHKFLSFRNINTDIERKVDELSDYVSINPLSKNYGKVDVEFVISDCGYYITQLRPLTTSVNPFLLYYAFPKLTVNAGYFYGDEDFNFISKTMSRYGFLVPNFKINSSVSCIDGIQLKKIIDHSFLLCYDKKVSLLLYEDIRKLIYDDFLNLKLNISKPFDVLFLRNKKFNFKVSFMKWIMSLLEQNVEMLLMRLGGINFLSQNLKSHSKNKDKHKNIPKSKKYYYTKSLFFQNCENESYLEMLSDNLSFLNTSLYDIKKKIHNVELIYHKLISKKTHYQGSIKDLCRMPYDKAISILENKEVKRKYLGVKRKFFPLSGITVYSGEVEGEAVIIKSNETLTECAGKIIIAKYLTIDLILAVCLLSSKKINSDLVDYLTDSNSLSAISKAIGIVTEYGGIASHAAIISREFGIPCLVSCDGVLEVINNGDIVRIAHNSLNLIKKSAEH